METILLGHHVFSHVLLSLCKAHFLKRGAGKRLRLFPDEPVIRFDTCLETVSSLAAFDEPPTEINDDEGRGDGKDEAADDNHAHQ